MSGLDEVDDTNTLSACLDTLTKVFLGLRSNFDAQASSDASADTSGTSVTSSTSAAKNKSAAALQQVSKAASRNAAKLVLTTWQ